MTTFYQHHINIKKSIYFPFCLLLPVARNPLLFQCLLHIITHSYCTREGVEVSTKTKSSHHQWISLYYTIIKSHFVSLSLFFWRGTLLYCDVPTWLFTYIVICFFENYLLLIKIHELITRPNLRYNFQWIHKQKNRWLNLILFLAVSRVPRAVTATSNQKADVWVEYQ